MADPIVEEIKQKLDIVDVVSNYLTLKKSGTNYKGNCPFHGEKTPSFMVNRERQMYRCFGCGEAGDILSFVMKQENIDFPNALQLLAAQAGVTLPERPEFQKRTGPDKTTLTSINNRASQLYHHILNKVPAAQQARDYLQKRGVSEASITAFAIGFAPRNNQSIHAYFQKEGTTQDQLKAAGNPERFRGRIMFPFRDVIGNVVGFSGRALGDEQPKYLNTAETDVFHKNRFLYGLYEGKKAIAEAGKVMVVEGQLDLVMAHQAGYNYTVATSGTALTHDHLRIIKRYSDILYLAFDGDKAGYKATERAIGMALEHGFEVSVVDVPDGSDPGELVSTQLEVWQQLVEKPMPVIDWLFRYYFPGDKKPTAKERDHIFTSLFPYIAHTTDPISRSYLLQRLANVLGLSQDKAVVDAFESWQATQKTPATKPSLSTHSPKSEASTVNDTIKKEAPKKETEAPEDEGVKRERNLIALILIQPSLLGYAELNVQEKEFTHIGFGRLYTIAQNWYTSHTNQSPTDLIKYVTQTFSADAKRGLEKLLFDTQVRINDLSPEQVLQEYAQLVQLIREQQRETRIQSFAHQIAQAEASGDRAKVAELISQMQHSLKEPNAKTNP